MGSFDTPSVISFMMKGTGMKHIALLKVIVSIGFRGVISLPVPLAVVCLWPPVHVAIIVAVAVGTVTGFSKLYNSSIVVHF